MTCFAVVFFSKRYLTYWDFETSSDHKIVVIFFVGEFAAGEFVCGRIHRKAWTACDDKCSILSSYVPSAGSKLIPG